MTSFPLGLPDISLLLAVISIILFITPELLSSYYRKINVKINTRTLRKTAMVFSALFLATLAVKIVGILLNVET